MQIQDGPDHAIDSINIDLVLGDATGLMHSQSGHRFYVEFNPYHAIRSSPPCNFLVEDGSELWLSQDFRVIGKRSPAVDLQGHMTGVFNITLAEGRNMDIGIAATNSRYQDGEYVYSPQGRILLAKGRDH